MDSQSCLKWHEFIQGRTQTKLALNFDHNSTSYTAEYSKLNYGRVNWSPMTQIPVSAQCGSHRTWMLHFNNNRTWEGTGEKSQCLRVHTVLAGNLVPFLAFILGTYEPSSWESEALL